MTRLRSDPVAVAAMASAQERGQAHVMDFLTLAGTNAAEGRVDVLSQIQKHSDTVCQLTVGLPMCHPDVKAATRMDGDLFLMGVQREDEAGWVEQVLQAHARNSDVILPVAAVLFANTAFSLLHWWVAVALLPGVALSTGFLSFVWQRYSNPLVALAPGQQHHHHAQSRSSIVMVIALLVVGASLFVFTLAPALGGSHPQTCMLLTAVFALNAWAFYRVVTRDAGSVPKGNSMQATHVHPEQRVCSTCCCVRPLRSKHDPFTGRCIRKFDHYCPLVANAVGEGNQGAFVAFCFTMFAGQLIFIRLCAAFLALHSESISFVLLHRFPSGWKACPVTAFNLGVQLLCMLFNLFLCARAVYGIVAELTTNEMENWERYTYLRDIASGEYSNPFDAGILANAVRFFSAGYTDWDSLLRDARAAPRRAPPLVSAATLMALLRRMGLRYRSRRHQSRGLAPQGHGHTHGGVQCDGHHHGHSHGSEGEDKDMG